MIDLKNKNKGVNDTFIYRQKKENSVRVQEEDGVQVVDVITK